MPSEYDVHVLRIAEADLDEIVAYIPADNRHAGGASRIEMGLMGLAKYPQLGRAPREPELAGAGFRYLVIDNYLVFYSIEESTIFIHRILHGARDYRRCL